MYCSLKNTLSSHEKNPNDRILKEEPYEQHLSIVPKPCSYLIVILQWSYIYRSKNMWWGKSYVQYGATCHYDLATRVHEHRKSPNNNYIS